MISRQLTGYHLLWFDLGTVLFLQNPKIRQTPAQDLESGHQIQPNHQFKDKFPVQRYRNIKHVSFTATGISIFHMYSQTVMRYRAFARSL